MSRLLRFANSPAWMVPILLCSTVLGLRHADAKAPLRQGNYDIVELTDGTVLERVRVQKFDMRELVVRDGRTDRTYPREKVFRVELNTASMRGIYKKAREAVSEENWAIAYEEYLGAAAKLKTRSGLKDFAPQFAYWRAYLISRRHGTPTEQQETLGELINTNKETGFYPNIWELRVQDSLRRGDSKDALQKAKETIAKFDEFAQAKLSEKYRVEAKIYEAQVKLALKELSGAQAQAAYKDLLGKVRGHYQDLANLLTLEIANAELIQNKIPEARELYREILKSGVADEDTMIGAYVGVGHTYLRQPERTKEDGRHALSNFMRAIVLYPDGDVERLGEACYHAIVAYRLWDPNATTEMRRLFTRLKRRYERSSWASKPVGR